jgi:hypothetical protein
MRSAQSCGILVDYWGLSPISGFYLVKHLELLLKEGIENSELRMEKGKGRGIENSEG